MGLKLKTNEWVPLTKEDIRGLPGDPEDVLMLIRSLPSVATTNKGTVLVNKGFLRDLDLARDIINVIEGSPPAKKKAAKTTVDTTGWMTGKAVSKLLDLPLEKIKELIDQAFLKGVPHGRGHLIDPKSVEEFQLSRQRSAEISTQSSDADSAPEGRQADSHEDNVGSEETGGTCPEEVQPGNPEGVPVSGSGEQQPADGSEQRGKDASPGVDKKVQLSDPIPNPSQGDQAGPQDGSGQQDQSASMSGGGQEPVEESKEPNPEGGPSGTDAKQGDPEEPRKDPQPGQDVPGSGNDEQQPAEGPGSTQSSGDDPKPEEEISIEEKDGYVSDEEIAKKVSGTSLSSIRGHWLHADELSRHTKLEGRNRLFEKDPLAAFLRRHKNVKVTFKRKP